MNEQLEKIPAEPTAETKQTIEEPEVIVEPPKEPEFQPTDEQLKLSRELTQHLFTIGLHQARFARGDRDSVRFDINIPKKKVIMSIFIYPDGSIEYDKYSTRGLKDGDALNKEQHFIESKCTDFKGLYSDLVHLSQIRSRL